MRIGENDNFFIDRSKKNIGFIGDSFVYGSVLIIEIILSLKLKNQTIIS